MTLFFTWGTSPGALGNQTVRLGKIDGLSQAADRGQYATCRLPVDDPSAIYTLAGLDSVSVAETAAANVHVWVGYAADRTVARGDDDSLITGAARRWDGSLVDLNAGFTFKVIRGSSAKRPVETVDARLAWLLSYASGFPDHGHVVSSSLELSAADYTGMFPIDVLNDCGERTGFNFFRYYDETATASSLAFFPDTYTSFDSTLRLTNVLADVDSSTTFDAQGTLYRDPSDRYNGVLVIYNGGTTFVSSGGGDDRQTSVTKDTISSAAHAQAFGQRFLSDHSIDVDRVTAVAWIAKAHVNDAMPGQRIQVKFSHLPGYTSYTYMRIAQRTVAQDHETPDYYTVTFDLRNPRSTGGSGSGPGGGGGSVGNPGPPPPPPPPWVPCPDVDPHYFSFDFTYEAENIVQGISDTTGLLVDGVTYNWSFTSTFPAGDVWAQEEGFSSFAGPAGSGAWAVGLNPVTEPIDSSSSPQTVSGSFLCSLSGSDGLIYAHSSANSIDHIPGRMVHVTGFLDPVDWVPPVPADCAPMPGQVVVSTDGAPELITMATGDTTGQTNWPYATGGLHIFVSGYGEVIVAQTDPTTGTFELPFPKPDGAQVYGWYIAGPGPTTGATNGPAISELDYIPPELLGSGSDRSGDNVLHDDWTWGPVSGSTSLGGFDVTPTLSNAMAPFVKPTGSGVITADAQGRLTIDSGSTYKAFPGMAFLEGRLHLVYRDGTAHNSSGGLVKYRHSDDLGRTWSSATTLETPTAGDDLRDPAIVALSSGRLLCVYDYRAPWNSTNISSRVIYSDNRGQSWSSPYTIPDTFSGAEADVTSQPIELPDGTILVPGYGLNSGSFYTSVVWKSTDGGLTFPTQITIANGTTDSRSYAEPQIRLLASGTLVCLMRSDTNAHTWRSTSTDGGATWSATADVLTASSRPDFVEFYPGALIFFGRNDNTNFYARWSVSWDEGATWTALQNVDGSTDPWMYGAPVVLAPGYIAVAYSIENSSSDADLYIRYYYDGIGIGADGTAHGIGTGTVTSVALSVPAELSVSGSPVTTAGTLAVTKATQSANQVWAGPTSGSAAQPAFRALVAADIPAGVGVTDHAHIDNVTFSGDGATTVFELPAAPFDTYSVQAFVAGVKVGQSLSGTMLTTLTFDTAPASGTDNISVDIVAVAA